MSDRLEGAVYQCPACDGKFPQPQDGGCPWCGLQFGQFNPIQRLHFPRQQHCQTVIRKKQQEDEEKGILHKIGGLFQ